MKVLDTIKAAAVTRIGEGIGYLVLMIVTVIAFGLLALVFGWSPSDIKEFFEIMKSLF